MSRRPWRGDSGLARTSSRGVRGAATLVGRLVVRAMRACPQPIIAAMQGFATGGGFVRWRSLATFGSP
eukprot:5833080-Prymnesium_polylepis.1